MRFSEYLEILRSPAREEPIEPKLDKVSEAKAREFREMQDLQQGAIMSATLEEGDTDAPQAACKAGDMVVLHYTVYGKDGKVLESTEAGKGGTGSPRAFIIGKGLRMPRGWEIVCAGMRPGQKVRSRIRPAYGFKDPNCRLPVPQGCAVDEELDVDLQLLGSCAGEAGVRCIGQPMPGTKEGSIIKRTLRHPASWENPRPPFEVTLGCSVRRVSEQELAADAPLGEPLYAAPAGRVTFTMGSGEAPAALEDALTFMGQGERSLLYVPGAALAPAASDAFGFPPAVVAAAQVVVELHLLSYVQVRDMTGGGEVVKKRVREGVGEFPVDCPVEDSTVRIHLRARQHAAGPAAAASPWLLDTREAPGGAPLEFPTGMGKLPEGVEMAVKLMLPGEVSLVTCQPSFAYQGRQDAPAGIDADAPVLFEAELVGFERQSHHQVMECAEKLALTRQLKEQGNELFRSKSLVLACQKYTKALKVVQSVHDWETLEEAAQQAQLKVDVLNNLAVVAYHRQQYAEAIDWCSKAIKQDEGQAKAFFRRGMSRSMKGDYEEAEPDLLRAAELDCSLSADVQEAMANNRLRSRTAELKQRREMRAFLS